MIKTLRGGGLSMSAHIIPREAAVPAPDMVENVRIAVIDSREGGTPSYVFSLNGNNDQTMRRVLSERAANHPAGLRTVEARMAEVRELFSEVYAAKQKHTPETPQTTERPDTAQQQTAKTRAPVVQITFDLGPAGRMVGRYKDVSIQDKLLILVADEQAVANGLYLPPSTPPGSNQTISVIIPGLDVPVRVFSVDMVFQYAGDVFCVLIIDRDDEL
jgi:hypothetical protein